MMGTHPLEETEAHCRSSADRNSPVLIVSFVASVTCDYREYSSHYTPGHRSITVPCSLAHFNRRHVQA